MKFVHLCGNIFNLINDFWIQDKDEKLKVTKKRLACIDNLAGFYRGVGDNKQAINLATYSYNQKQKIRRI